MTAGQPAPDAEIARLERRVRRETAARKEAEAIAERGLRDLFLRQQEIALLESIAAAANEAEDVGDPMRHALQAICRHTGWPLGHLWLVPDGDDAHAFESTAIWYDDAPPDDALLDNALLDDTALRQAGPRQALRACTESAHFVFGVGLPGRVVQDAAPVWVEVAGADPAVYPRLAQIAAAGFASMFAFPVKVGADVAAVLEFFSVERQAPDEALLRLMGQIGTQLGRVIERRRAHRRLLHDALHDPLTQLGNRKLCVDRLGQLMLRAQRLPDHRFAVLFVDLDRFKAVNDGLGHQCGDDLIAGTARRLTSCLRQADLVARDPAVTGKNAVGEHAVGEHLVARLGGDEFVILLDGIAGAERAIVVAERIMAVLAEPFEMAGQRVFVTASIGIALSASGYGDVPDILRDADIAMYHAKQTGRARWVMFDQTMQLAAVRRLQLEADLREALAHKRLFLQYQPIVSPHDGRMRGFEALLRWRHPVHGLVPPNEFIPVAEEIGLIGPIGAWVLEEACRQLRIWQQAHDAALEMSVNVSAIQFTEGDLVGTVRRVLDASGIAPASLKLELTESAVMADAERALGVFGALRALGVRISLDDFGTGYSSLSYLRRLPIDTLKIDRSFVSQLDRFDDKRQIVDVVMMLARALGLDVVAEGVETEAELGLLRAMGCDFVQGYFYYRPLAPDAVDAALRAQCGRARAAA